MMVVFSTADLINIALKTWVFTQADKDVYYAPNICENARLVPAGVKTDPNAVPPISREDCEKQNELSKKQQEDNRIAQKQRDVVRDLSMIAVGIPLFLIHWRIVRRKDENL